MQTLRIAINGCGRIGGTISKLLLLSDHPELRLVAINDRGSALDIQDFLQRDSIYGRFVLPIRVNGSTLLAGDQRVTLLQQEEPQKLPWKKLRVDVVIEATGSFVTERAARAHLAAGATQVIITTAPHSGQASYQVRGTDSKHHGDITAPILTHGSCTTSAVAPVMCLVREALGDIKTWNAFAVQSATHSQSVVDKSHGQGRRRRQVLNNIIPVTLDTDRAIPRMFSGGLGNYVGQGVRVPTPIVHLAVLNIVLKKKVTVQQANAAIQKKTRENRWRGIVRLTHEPLVSQDVRQTTESAIIDGGMTKVSGDTLLQLGIWYDNEWPFAHRIIDLLGSMARQNEPESAQGLSEL